jgi:hypothetical protein
MKELPIGITGLGVLSPDNPPVDLDTRFKMACETQLFDYLDQTPGPGEVEAFRAASERHGLPLRAGGFYYRLGRDDELLMWHLRVGRDLGVQVHNVQIFTHHARDPKSPLGQVTMEFIPFPDYGGGARYSILANNIACAKWVRDNWNQLAH